MERRQEILSAAIELFVKKGYGATTVRDIGNAVGVSSSLLYLYFPSKEEILVTIVQEVVQQASLARQSSRDLPVSDVALRLDFCFSNIVSVVDRYSDLHLIIYRESTNLPKDALRRITQAELEMVGIFQEILEEGIEKGVFREHDTMLTAQTLLLIAHMWALKRWSLPKRYGLKVFCQKELAMVLSGVLAEPKGSGV